MSDEGVRLVARGALILVLILGAAVVRTAVGPSKKRGLVMGAGGFTGLAAGILLSYPIRQWFRVELSVISACLGMLIGWAVAWTWAKRVPREAS